MKRALLLSFLLFAILLQAGAQQPEVARLQKLLKKHPQADTFRVNRLGDLSQAYRRAASFNQADSAAHEAYTLAQKLGYQNGEGNALLNLGKVQDAKGETKASLVLYRQAYAIAKKSGDETLLYLALDAIGANISLSDPNQGLAYYLQAEGIAEKLPDKRRLVSGQLGIAAQYADLLGDYPKAMEWALKALKTSEEIDCLRCKAVSWNSIARVYSLVGDQAKSLAYYKRALEVLKKLGEKSIQYTTLINMGESYRLMGKYPEAIQAYTQTLQPDDTPDNISIGESNLADVYVRTGNLPLAFQYAFSSLKKSQKTGNILVIAWINGILSRAYLKAGKPDSALYRATIGLAQAKQVNSLEIIRNNYAALAEAYAAKKDFDHAYQYHKLYISYRDSMSNTQIINNANLQQYNFDLAKKQAQITILNQQKKEQYYFLIGSLGVLMMIIAIGFILYKSNRQKQKANMLLQQQKQLVEEQRDQTNAALKELQQTQTQLIQREKMASFGELTAGIAHEIQNPLNFVNNFSEVNLEMIGELKDERLKDKKDERLQDELILDLEKNLEKISHHGKRADFIVKGMLEHSRAGTAEKQPTNINKLADEFLKLSYHGLRAKDKSFNADMKTSFDPDLPRVDVVQQDIGRVLLNLFNNAFYAVNQKSKTVNGDYKPEVTVATAHQNGQVIVKVKDNGSGIPDSIRDKIMQPFFTTKPPGEGTGLGLSLSYDIVVKGHGGSISVETKEGDGSEFTVTLPV